MITVISALIGILIGLVILSPLIYIDARLSRTRRREERAERESDRKNDRDARWAECTKRERLENEAFCAWLDAKNYDTREYERQRAIRGLPPRKP